jgi:hypothetical protein
VPPRKQRTCSSSSLVTPASTRALHHATVKLTRRRWPVCAGAPGQVVLLGYLLASGVLQHALPLAPPSSSSSPGPPPLHLLLDLDDMLLHSHSATRLATARTIPG